MKKITVETLEDYLFERYCIEGDENISEFVDSLRQVTNNESVVFTERKRNEEELESLKGYIRRPKITLDGREYVDKKAFTELVTRKMLVEAKDCESVDEKLGFEMCIQIIENL